MIKQIKEGLVTYVTALPFLLRKSILPFVLLGSFLSLAIGGLLFYGIYQYSDDLAGVISGLLPFEWGRAALEKVLVMISGALMFLIFGFLFRYIIMVILAPILSIISERVEAELTGSTQRVGFSIQRMIRDIIRGLALALKNIIKEMFYSFILFIMSFIAVLAPITTALLFIVQFYFSGFGNMDYYMERHFNVRDSQRFVSKNKGIAIGNGAVFYLLLLVPVAGWIMAPVLATIAATIASTDHKGLQETLV